MKECLLLSSIFVIVATTVAADSFDFIGAPDAAIPWVKDLKYKKIRYHELTPQQPQHSVLQEPQQATVLVHPRPQQATVLVHPRPQQATVLVHPRPQQATVLVHPRPQQATVLVHPRPQQATVLVHPPVAEYQPQPTADSAKHSGDQKRLSNLLKKPQQSQYYVPLPQLKSPSLVKAVTADSAKDSGDPVAEHQTADSAKDSGDPVAEHQYTVLHEPQQATLLVRSHTVLHDPRYSDLLKKSQAVTADSAKDSGDHAHDTLMSDLPEWAVQATKDQPPTADSAKPVAEHQTADSAKDSGDPVAEHQYTVLHEPRPEVQSEEKTNGDWRFAQEDHSSWF